MPAASRDRRAIVTVVLVEPHTELACLQHLSPRGQTYRNIDACCTQVIAASVTTNEGSQLKSQVQTLKIAIEKLL